ncbi:RNA polymerase recycling motor HelD [Bacillus massiliglaciei]|uniref:RNA polymerase recycling motor HelD n=1 Tax=Bacillus massiliglaciei TaxID=1816693 RepID=UPI000AA5A693|nr:RNA polymerase recycling motor HelD [Bacillus massiliglaciei]
MASKQHPDMKEEQKRLDFTKRYMDVIIKTAESSKDQFRKYMQETFGDEDWQESGRYSELLTTANFFEMSKTELESLKAAQGKPYFARVDFNRKGNEIHENLYFGKTSLYQRETQEQIIVDWRSPIANLYYEGRVGPVEYEAEGELFSGEITLKRQLMIEDGQLQEIRDIDLTTTDELLQESLAKSSSSRLTDIVSTIQEEQNRIIRADLNKPIIVQGAAGSGKTTIALHRISYFLYQYKEQFDPRQLMILAPSRLFIDYISEALPELGVEKAKQFTLAEYVQLAIEQKLYIIPDRKLVNLLETHDSEIEESIWISRMKGSLMFKEILDRYVQDILLRFCPNEDFYCDTYRLYSKRKFSKLLTEEYWYLPVYSRVEKLRQILQNQVKAKKKTMLGRVNEFYERKIDRALTKVEDPVMRREYVTNFLAKKEEREAEVQREIKTSVQRYFKNFERKTLLPYYKELFSDPGKLSEYSGFSLSLKEAARICSYQKVLLHKKQYELEDLGPLLYLHSLLFGVKKENQAKNIVIDEAQDYSFMQLQALKTSSDTDMFTLVGDLAQGIYSYRGLESWDAVHQDIFPRATYTELKKSYRTTIEIMNEANKLLDLLPYRFPQVEPVVRHGREPEFIMLGPEWVKNLSDRVNELKKEGMKTFAVITKTMADGREAFKNLSEFSNEAVLLEEEASIPRDKMVILPSYLAKGLEFDAVFALSLHETYVKDSELDVKLLYVVMTRPLHRLYFIGKSERDFIRE